MASGGGGGEGRTAAPERVPLPNAVDTAQDELKEKTVAFALAPGEAAPAAPSSFRRRSVAKNGPKELDLIKSLEPVSQLDDEKASTLDQMIRERFKEVTGQDLPADLSLTKAMKQSVEKEKKVRDNVKEQKKKTAEENLEKLWTELDEIKVTMMHDMVRTVDTTVSEQQVKSRFMYLTNAQAAKIGVDEMPRVREALGIFKPKMVIRLMPSRYGIEYWRAFKNWSLVKNGQWDGRFPYKQVPELCDEDIEETEHRLILLVKEVLLPLAMDSHALVMGNETCSLVTAFAKVSAPLIRQHGKKCPFSLLIFGRAQYFTVKAQQENSVARAFYQQSQRWKREAENIEAAMKERWGDDEGFWPVSDLFAGEYSLILFEGVSKEQKPKLAEETSFNFQNDFIQSLSTFLPVIAVQTYGTEKMSLLPAMADHAKRGLPLFLLDSRIRPKDSKQEPLADVDGFAEPEVGPQQGSPAIDMKAALEAPLSELAREGFATGEGFAEIPAPRASQEFRSEQGRQGSIRDLFRDEPQDSTPREPEHEPGQPSKEAQEEVRERSGSMQGMEGSIVTTEARAPFCSSTMVALTFTEKKVERKQIANDNFRKALVRKLAKQLKDLHHKPNGGCVDFYTTSLIAYVKGEVNKACPGKLMEEEQQQKDKWLWKAISDGRKEISKKNQESDKVAKHSKEDPDEKLHVQATDIVMAYYGEDTEWESKCLRKRCEDAIEEIRKATTWPELRERLSANWCKLRGYTFHKYRGAEKLAKEESAWLEFKKFKGRDDPCECNQLVIKDGEPPGDVEAAKKKLCDLLVEEKNRSASFASRNTAKAIKGNEQLWMSVYELMRSDHVYVGSLHNISDIRNKLFQQHAQIDRLPQKNTQESLILLRQAWVLVDLYNDNAWTYKYISKFSYFFTLLLGVAIVVVSVLQPFYPEVLTESNAQFVLLGLALGLSGVAGATTMVDPSTKWLVLRGTALAMESEIWKFRTRVGEYHGRSRSGLNIGQTEAERVAEGEFHERINALQDKVHQSSGLKDTSFYSNSTATDDSEEDHLPPVPPSLCRQLCERLGLASPEQEPGRLGEGGGGCCRCSRRHDQVHAVAQRKLEGQRKDAAQVPQEPITPGDGPSPGCCSALSCCRRSGEKRMDDDLGRRRCGWLSVCFRCCRSTEEKRASLYRHGQYRSVRHMKPKPSEVDNFHSPADANHYIRHRLVPQLQFYQRRIPAYSIWRRLFQSLLLVASIVNALLAALEEPTWTAIVASVSGAFAAWQEFSSTAKKLERYSTAAHNLSNLLLWWQALPEVDQKNVRKIEDLVLRTEGLLGGERSAWLSDAQQAVALAKEASRKAAGEAGGDSKSKEKEK